MYAFIQSAIDNYTGANDTQGGGSALVGQLGDIVFEVSADTVRTWEELSISREADWADHNVIGQKPASEFTGLKLITLDLKITFNSALGVSPVDEMNDLITLLEDGEPADLVLCGQAMGQFTVRSIGESWNYTNPEGPDIIEVDVSLTEYIETMPSQADEKSREDELMRSDTGKGGPAKLPGASDAPANKPKLKANKAPAFDPITREPIGKGSIASSDGAGMDFDVE